MKTPDEVTAFVQKQGFAKAEWLNKWEGYEVFEPIPYGVEEGDIAYIGVPLFVLLKDGEMRTATTDEAYAIIQEGDDE